MAENTLKLQRPYRDEEARANLKEFIRSRDRATPPVFVGRDDIIHAIMDDVISCRTNVDPVRCFTRVIQGAPGAGKTSLLHEIRSRLSGGDETVGPVTVVNLRGSELSISNAIAQSFIAGYVGSNLDVTEEKTTSSTGKLDAKLLSVDRQWTSREKGLEQQIQSAGSVWTAIRQNSPSIDIENDVCLLLVDETQAVADHDGSNESHITNIATALHCGFQETAGLKIVPIFAGLSNTKSVLADCGVSRVPEDSSTNLGSLSQDETEELVNRWLRQESFGFDALVADADIQRVSQMIAVASEGWPRHVTTYLRALSGSILDAGLRDRGIVDLNEVFEQGHNSRLNFYNARLDSADLDRYVGVICAAAKGSISGVVSNEQLDILAKDVLGMSQIDSVAMRKRAIRAGVLEEDRTSGLDSLKFPIPSFHTYMQCEGVAVEFKKRMRDQLDSHSHLWLESKGLTR